MTGERAHALRHWLERNAAATPDKVWIHAVDQGVSITHAEGLEACLKIGAALAARGIGAGDRVALLSNNALEHLLVYVGGMAYGATVCTVHVEVGHLHFPALLAALKPKLVLHEAALGLDRFADHAPCDWRPLGRWARARSEGWFAEVAACAPRAAPPVNAWRDDASIFFTSGTADTPKGVVVTFAELIENSAGTAEAFAIGRDDRFLDFRSYNWLSAQTLSCLGVLAAGGTLVMARRFSRSRFFDWVREHAATCAAGNPTTLNMLVNRPVAVTAADLPHLRYITSSSAPLPVADWKRFEETYGIPIAQGYGTSETGWICASTETTRRLGSVGRPLAYRSVRIVDEAGAPLPAGAIGAIEVGGPAGVEFRYLGEDGAIRVNARGRTLTGDLGYLDADGFLFVTGRARDLIIRGGVNIAPLEIDNVVLELPAVAEACSIGVPDPIYGEAVAVYVVAKDGAALAAADIAAHCAARLPEIKRPAEIVLTGSLPKTERGKLDRRALQAAWRAARGVEA